MLCMCGAMRYVCHLRIRPSICVTISFLPNLHRAVPGLDSYSALSVMQYMRAMADTGHTIVASIHQPRSAIWNMFTKVGGRGGRGGGRSVLHVRRCRAGLHWTERTSYGLGCASVRST